MVTLAELQAFTPDDGADEVQAQLALDSAKALVAAYCRDNHLTRNGDPRPGVSTVVLTAAARILANPGQVVMRDQAGSFSRHRGQGFNGFTLAELAVLNRYRKRVTG